MSNVNIIVDTKLQPYTNLQIVQIKQNRFTSNERTDQRNKPILILVLVAVLSNESPCEPVPMCKQTCQSLRCSYTQSNMEVDDQMLER